MYLNEALGQLVVLSDCVCPGHELRLQCTVVGSGATVWRGTAFNCIYNCHNDIFLRHSQFESGISRECNNGRIIGRSINTTSDSDGVKYISQLIIQLDEKNTLDGRTVECIYDDGLVTKVIGIHYYTRGILLNNNSKQIKFHKRVLCKLKSFIYPQIPHLLKMSIFLILNQKLTGID